MSNRPNILLLMADQMQGRISQPGHPCQTPNLDAVAARGLRFDRAYTPNAICSPARASLMTGLLPHNHGVLWVTHNVDEDQGLLRTSAPHWAQRLVESGYRTGYFGKWHVERSELPTSYGWQTDGSMKNELFQRRAKEIRGKGREPSFALARYYDRPPGYRRRLHYAVTDEPPEQRGMGIVTGLAADWLRGVVAGDQPWCCFVSVTEPHDPFVAGEEAFSQYDVDAMTLPESARDSLDGRPGIYAKAAEQWRHLTDRQMREAMACYYASVTEIDRLFGQLVGLVDEAGQLENTIVIVTSDHGELLGAHGMYCKNIMASEEIYNIPLIMAGPGISAGQVSRARVGLHDLAPTIPVLAGADSLEGTDGRELTSLLANPQRHEDDFDEGYAEYHGGRYLFTQRVLWQGDWKFVFNGFDYDELYDLANDPNELTNLARDPAYAETVDQMMRAVWRKIETTGDTSLHNADYPQLRVAIRGPLDG